VGAQRRRDGHHLDERPRALLHAGAPGGRGGEQRQSLGDRPLDGAQQPVRGHDVDGTAEEAELAGHHGDAPAGDRALAGDDRLVRARARPGPRQRGGVGGVGGVAGREGSVPRRPRPGVDDPPDQIPRP
jgi:hypothetical protein